MTLWQLVYALDLFAIILFAISYYFGCYRRGYRIDFWHAGLFQTYVLPNLLMLPFARSDLNVIVVGKDLAAVQAALPKVFLITLLGYFAMLIGGSLWALRVNLGLRAAAGRVLDIMPRCSMMLMSSRSILVFQALLCLLLQAVILSMYFAQSGFGFDLRDYTFAHPELRPVALIASNYSVIIASHCLARYVDTKEKALLACTVLLSAGLTLFGARANLIGIYVGVLLLYLIKLRERLSLLRLFIVIVSIVVVGFYLGQLRAGNYSVADFFAVIEILLFYGNNFSDLRDFSWVYSGWDHTFWIGKTYLAGATAFVPRFASQFRDTWGIGVATDTVVGLNPQIHPGLRPGMFGEGYFNFGLLGVIVVGFVSGVIFKYIDGETKRALSGTRTSMMKAFAATTVSGVAACIAISSNTTALYILLGGYLFSWLCLEILRLFRKNRGDSIYSATPREGSLLS